MNPYAHIYEGSSECKPINTSETKPYTHIPTEVYNQFEYLGLIPSDVRLYNQGDSNYSKKIIQPWSIWLDYPELTSWDHDIIKRTLRTKGTDPRILDYQKIIHICNERIRQLKD